MASTSPWVTVVPKLPPTRCSHLQPSAMWRGGGARRHDLSPELSRYGAAALFCGRIGCRLQARRLDAAHWISRPSLRPLCSSFTTRLKGIRIDPTSVSGLPNWDASLARPCEHASRLSMGQRCFSTTPAAHLQRARRFFGQLISCRGGRIAQARQRTFGSGQSLRWRRCSAYSQLKPDIQASYWFERITLEAPIVADRLEHLMRWRSAPVAGVATFRSRRRINEDQLISNNRWGRSVARGTG